MNHPRTLLASVTAAVISLVLGAATPGVAAAGVSIHFSTGSPGHGHHHRPRYSHGVPFISRGHVHGHRHGHRFPRHRRHGYHGGHVLGSGCSPATRRYRDRHGHLVIHRVTVCHDRYGRRYVLGGRPGH